MLLQDDVVASQQTPQVKSAKIIFYHEIEAGGLRLGRKV